MRQSSLLAWQLFATATSTFRFTSVTRFSQALRQQPDCQADIRLGLAACFVRLNSPSKARATFERMLQLDPLSCGALLGLAALALSSADTNPK